MEDNFPHPMKNKLGPQLRGWQTLTRLNSNWIFALGLVIMLFFQVGLVYEVKQSRALPVEPDDAYCYIMKALQLKECFRQDSPALQDLRLQLTPSKSDPPAIALDKWRSHAFIFVLGTPLYSLILMSLAKVFDLSLEKAFNYMSIGGSVAICLAIALFLKAITDNISAGIALVFLAIATFSGHGIHYIVASNLTMALGIIMVAHLIKRNGQPGILFFLLNIAALGLHPIGPVYIGLAVILGVAYQYPKPILHSFIPFLPSCALVVVYWLTVHYVTTPLLAALPQIKPADTSYFSEVAINFKRLLQLLGKWIKEHGFFFWPQEWRYWVKDHWLFFSVLQIAGTSLGFISLRLRESLVGKIIFVFSLIIAFPLLATLGMPMLLAFILFQGFKTCVSEKERGQNLSLGIFSLSLILACFHVLYLYPAELVMRLYIPWAIIMTAIFSQGLYALSNGQDTGFPWKNHLLIVAGRPLSLSQPISRFLLILFLVIGIGPRLGEAYNIRSQIKKQMIQRQDIAFDFKQVHLMQEKTSHQDVILYENDLALLYYLCYGGLQRRAVYLPYLPLPDGFSVDPSAVKLLAGWNPFLTLPKEIKYPFQLPPGGSLTLVFNSGGKIHGVELFGLLPQSNNTVSKVTLILQGSEQDSDQVIEISNGTWQLHSLRKPFQGEKLTLINPVEGKDIKIAGIKLHPRKDDGLNWPWHNLVQIVYHAPDIPQPRSFTPPRVYQFNGYAYHCQVVSDGGATVLWELRMIDKNSNNSQ